MELIDSACNRVFLYEGTIGPLRFYLIKEHFGAGGYRNPMPKENVYLRRQSALRHYAESSELWAKWTQLWPDKSEEENREFYRTY